MPIVVQHAPATLVGQLAVQVGRGRGRERQMTRDMQLTQMMMQAQERGADVAAARAERAEERTFALQRGLATRMARARPGKPSIQAQRQLLRNVVSEAKRSGVYGPGQVKRMEFLSELGDEASVRKLLAEKPLRRPVEPSTIRERELKRQTTVMTKLVKKSVNELKFQIEDINTQIEDTLGYGPAMQALAERQPSLIPENFRESFVAMFAQRRKLQGQITDITQRAATHQQLLAFGVTMPEQLEAEMKQQAESQRLALKLAERQAEQVGELTDRERLEARTISDLFDDSRRPIESEIRRLSRDLGKFVDEDDEEYQERITPVQQQITAYRRQLTLTYGEEKRQLAALYKRRTPEDTRRAITDSRGVKWQLVGYENEEPVYEEVE